MLKYLGRWFSATSHKDISTLYFSFGWGSGVMGLAMSMMIRSELSYPKKNVSGHMYNTWITSHALLMIFFFIMPVLMGGFGNLLIPFQLGCADLVFPRLNMLSYSFLPGALVFLLTSSFA